MWDLLKLDVYALPFTVDYTHDKNLQNQVPTLAEMTYNSKSNI